MVATTTANGSGCGIGEGGWGNASGEGGEAVSGSKQTAEELATIIGRKHTDCPAVRRAMAKCAAGWRLLDAVPPIEADMRHARGDYPADAKAVTLAHGKFGFAGLVGVFCPSRQLSPPLTAR